MGKRLFFAARAERVLDHWVERTLRSFGWREKVICNVGYGTPSFIRVFGKVVLQPGRASSGLAKDVEYFLRRRGFRNFVNAPTTYTPVKITVGDKEVRTTTDRSGYIDIRINDHELPPGWNKVQVSSRGSKPVWANVQVVPEGTDFGIISDIDDTVITTWLPRPAIAFWNSFIRDESNRQAPPAMAAMYRKLLDEHPGAPIFYVSTGSWDTYPFLRRFLRKHRFPKGSMLLTDWGPTNTGFFRSGSAHKVNSLLQLAMDFPNIRWILVGDDGQHDIALYTTFAANAPDRVRAILIRQLTPGEHVLAHGMPVPVEDFDRVSDVVKIVRASDGRGLAAGLRDINEE